VIDERALESNSGLRPASAFLFVGVVFVAVAAAIAGTAFGVDDTVRRWEQDEQDPSPAYTITDRDERPVALFVQRLDLVLSPNAMWQAHTPERVATELASVLGCGVNELAMAMMPDATGGVIRTSMPLDTAAAARIQSWIQTGNPAQSEAVRGPIQGMWICRDERGAYVLCWQPFVVLSATQRVLHGNDYGEKPRKWARHIADGLALCMMGEYAVKPGEDELALEEQRSAVWSWLMPTTYTVAVRGFDASRAPKLIEILSREKVAHHQMRVERGRDREYPAGRFPFLGLWGYVDEPVARRAADRALELVAEGTPSATANAALVEEAQEISALVASLGSVEDEGGYEAVISQVHDVRGRATWDLLSQPLPLSGLERACDRLLADESRWGFLEEQSSGYRFLRHRAVRAGEARSYFLESSAPSEPPRVVTTFDLMLQRQVGIALDELMDTHKPALAMAVALDLKSGDVLAVDSRSSYPLLGFPPLYHEFTPGSTFKVNVMACAIEAGAVSPNDTFNVGNGTYMFGKRRIREAESSKTGTLTAAQCLAHSVNSGLVQIGDKVTDEFLHGKFRALHYSEAPKSGFGGERPGYLPKLPWKREWTQASISFGHELKVTLWQHAAGLAAIVRGGHWLPLRVLEAVEQNGERFTLPRAQPEPVFSAATSETIRAMMQVGAREGTGAPVASPEKLPTLVVGTKTGTAQKVGTEVCLHHELAHQADHWKQGTKCSRECRLQLVNKPREKHSNCYTSSMCIWGRRDAGGREVLVLVVVEEPRGGQKYGSRVAGPTAVRILKEALGETRNGAPVVEPITAGFAPAIDASSERGIEQPWAEVGR
jgi:cell division protein FtsI/penicillin-binding protein 2